MESLCFNVEERGEYERPVAMVVRWPVKDSLSISCEAAEASLVQDQRSFCHLFHKNPLVARKP
jgi:hypothetical protein